jgi:hypothetical protein
MQTGAPGLESFYFRMKSLKHVRYFNAALSKDTEEGRRLFTKSQIEKRIDFYKNF